MDDLISRQALLDKFEPWLKVKDYNDGELNVLKAILYEIRFMRSAQPAFDARDTQYNLPIGTDCISRQAAIDAFNTNLNELVVGGEENAKTVENYLNRVLDKIKCLPSALGTNLAEVGTDTISRQAAINKILGQPPEPHYPSWYAEQIKELPPAEPKRAKWERHYSRPGVFADLCWHCSACGYKSSDGWANKFNFCPNCGSYNGGET